MNLNLTPLQIVGIVLVINGALIGSTSQLTDLFGAHLAHMVISIASLGNSILGGIVTMFSSQSAQIRNVVAMPGIEAITVNNLANPALATIAVDPAQLKVEATPQAAAAVNATARAALNILIAALLLSAFLFAPAASAQTRRLTGNPVADIKAGIEANTGSKLTGDLGNDLIKALDAKLLPDLQYALKLSQATGSKVTGPCWQAWIDIIQTQQKAVTNADGTELPAPDPHLITSFERMVELRNALQPDSDFMIKCSPVASMVKKDIASFMGIVISGGAGIATMIPGL